ncbi:MAG: phasin family protein [Geminicoccaceae bacterium]
MFESFAVPGMDMGSLMALQQKNLEALARANQLLMEAAQAVAKREFEIMQSTMDEAVKATKDLAGETDPKANASMRLDLAKQSVETALNNMREITEMAVKSNQEAFGILNKRTLESFDEAKKAIAKTA